MTDYKTLALGILAAINTALISFNVYHLSNEQLQAVNEIVSYAIIVWTIWKNHHKETPLN